MRLLILIMFFAAITGEVRSQNFLYPGFGGNTYGSSYAMRLPLNDSSSKQKWSVSRYSAISSSFMVFKGGSASMISVPVGVQLNRRLNNNLYAFGGLSLAPSYVNFNSSFMNNNVKSGQNNLYKTGNLGIYSRAELGLQYINDDRTFSISGSIGVERSNYPMFQPNQMNYARPNPVLPSNR